MEKNLLKFVWTHGKSDTIKTLIVTFMTFPVIYISLEIPKIIVNKALGAGKTPVEFPNDYWGIGWEMSQLTFLLVLCTAFIILVFANNGLKFLLNVQIGLTSERMLRRLRFSLFEQVTRFRIKRFQNMKQGEIVQSVMGEVEPLGGFFGEVVSTPVWQGGMLAVYMTFILIQDIYLGIAAIALYPVQGYIVPKLQKKVVRLNKMRVANVRRIADHIGESVGAMEEIHANDTARWHLSNISARLHENFSIRLQIFKRKYLIKGLNNFMIALTPFAFYLFGGIQVLNGNLEIGSLVAVLAAYKDVAAPWKALLNYFQRWTDLNGRFELVCENFSGDEVYGADRVYDTDATPLKGNVELRSANWGPGASGLNGATCKAPEGKVTAVVGGEDGARDVVMKMMAGLIEPESGRVVIGDTQITEASLPAIGAGLAYVGTENTFFAGPLRDNISYSLRRQAALLSASDLEDAALRSKEAELTGNFPADPNGDWTDYAAAGVTDFKTLEQRMIDLAVKVGLEEELFAFGLQSRIRPERRPEAIERILETRALVREAATEQKALADLIEFWDENIWNSNASGLENALFAMPVKARDGLGDYAEDPAVVEALKAAGAYDALIQVGENIAEQLVELLGAVDEDSSLLDSFTEFNKKDIVNATKIFEAMKIDENYELDAEGQRIMLAFALAFVPTRDRLEVIDADLEATLLAARKTAIGQLRDNDYFVSFGEERFSPALTVSENLLDGKRRYNRRSAWGRFDDFLETSINKIGLRDTITKVGLNTRLGSGGAGLSTSSKRKAALIRAMIKKPALMIVDGVAGGPTPEEKAIRDAIREEMAGATVVITLSDNSLAMDADHVILVTNAGTTTDGPPAEVLASA